MSAEGGRRALARKMSHNSFHRKGALAVSSAQPATDIEFAEREVGRLREELESWKQALDQLDECWPGEELVVKANVLFGRIMDLDTDIQEGVLEGRIPHDPRLDAQVGDLLKQWLDTSLPLVLRIDRGGRGPDQEAVEANAGFREKIGQARMILTPDPDFFRDDRLIDLRDAAIEAHRSSLTKPLLNNGRAE